LDGGRPFVLRNTNYRAELFIKNYSEFYGLKRAITRFGVIAGPRQMGKTDQGRRTLWMAKHFWSRLKITLGMALGKQVRDFCTLTMRWNYRLWQIMRSKNSAETYITRVAD